MTVETDGFRYSVSNFKLKAIDTVNLGLEF